MMIFNVETHGDIRFRSICRRYIVTIANTPHPVARPFMFYVAGWVRFASSWVMNVEWPSGELIVAVAASLWAQRLMAEADHHAGLVRHRWRLDRARQARPVCLSCALGRLLCASPSVCTLHARGCDGMIAPSRRRHSNIYTECHRHESHMLACHTQPCEVRAAPRRRSRRRQNRVKVVGRGGGERPCR